MSTIGNLEIGTWDTFIYGTEIADKRGNARLSFHTCISPLAPTRPRCGVTWPKCEVRVSDWPTNAQKDSQGEWTLSDQLYPPYILRRRGRWLPIIDQWSGRFLGITGWDPNVWKPNRLHVDILRFSFVELGYILQIPLKRSVIFLQSCTSTGYFSNSAGSLVTNCRFSPIIVIHSRSMIGENRWLVTDEPVEFKEEPVEVQDCRKITDRFRRIHRIVLYPNLIKENRRTSICNWLNLQTVGS